MIAIHAKAYSTSKQSSKWRLDSPENYSKENKFWQTNGLLSDFSTKVHHPPDKHLIAMRAERRL